MDLDRLTTSHWKDLPTIAKKETLEEVMRAEKKTFPSSEVFQFDQELKKRNTSMIVILDADAQGGKQLVAYMVYVRMRRLTLLHKICVLERYRGLGVAKTILTTFCKDMLKTGCDCVQLWVDEARLPAQNLYRSCGFIQLKSVNDYYSPGRTGLHMALTLSDD